MTVLQGRVHDQDIEWEVQTHIVLTLCRRKVEDRSPGGVMIFSEGR